MSDLDLYRNSQPASRAAPAPSTTKSRWEDNHTSNFWSKTVKYTGIIVSFGAAIYTKLAVGRWLKETPSKWVNDPKSWRRKLCRFGEDMLDDVPATGYGHESILANYLDTKQIRSTLSSVGVLLLGAIPTSKVVGAMETSNYRRQQGDKQKTPDVATTNMQVQDVNHQGIVQQAPVQAITKN